MNTAAYQTTDKSELSARSNCDAQILKPLVYLFISAVLDYVIWDEKDKSQMQLELIYSVLPKIKTE